MEGFVSISFVFGVDFNYLCNYTVLAGMRGMRVGGTLVILFELGRSGLGGIFFLYSLSVA